MLNMPISVQLKRCGTAGGADPPLTPTEMALTPVEYRAARAFLVKPGTSRKLRTLGMCLIPNISYTLLAS